MCTVMVNKPIY